MTAVAERRPRSDAEILRAHNITPPRFDATGSGYTTCPNCSALRKPANTVRFYPKEFRQRRPDGNGGWHWNLDGVRRVLYRLPELLAAKKADPTQPVLIVEGEKDADRLRELGAVATCNPMGAGKWRDEYAEFLRGFEVVAVIADKDEPGRAHAQQVAASVAAVVSHVRVVELPGEHVKDAADFIAADGTLDEIYEIAQAAPGWAPPANGAGAGAAPQEGGAPVPVSRLRPVTLAEFLALDVKPREMVLDPIIPEKGLVMIYAARGMGKTHVALGIAYAVATGTNFLRWTAPTPRRVLLADGEMPAAALQERLASIVAGGRVDAAPDMLWILAGDLIEEGGIGNLASPAVQAQLDPYLADIDLLILDNLSSLTAVIRDNDAESWGPIQSWLLRLRRRGISVLIVHHAGKAGQQRGTSRREDVLDSSISLRRPTDYSPTEGARFEVHLEKARGVYGDTAKPFEARLETRDSAAVWTTRDIEDVSLARVQALLDDGLSVRDIAEETGIPKSTVHRLKRKAKAEASERRRTGGGDDGDDR
jgi:hypothetical protein